MKRTKRENRGDFRDLLTLYRTLAKEEDGSMTIFACFMIFCMMLIGGIGVDMMSHEMERTRIQAVADRAVLAAADLDQQLDPEAVVRDYFAKSGMSEFVSSVDVDQGINYRTVTVDASTSLDTIFMSFLGVEELSVPALSTAEEKINKVEISMVLDISGSMRYNSKMANLSDAAGVFVDTVLTPDNRDLISVSVVPYTAQVNAGEDIFSLMSVNQRHQYSYCVDFDDEDFNDTGIYTAGAMPGAPYVHMQHFDIGYAWNGNYSYDPERGAVDNPGCPQEDFETIFAFSQDSTALKDRFAQFQPRANTAIHLGMKWGVAMLDPAWRPFNQALSGSPTAGVDPAFAQRPSNYGDTETLKTVILMTDGENVTTNRINDNHHAYFNVYANSDHARHWANYPLSWYLNNYVQSSERWKWYYAKYSASQADSLLHSVCDAAKRERIIIWSIGFEVTDHGANVMRDCASSPSHFFRVEGVEITEAFRSIARQINQLRLTQ